MIATMIFLASAYILWVLFLAVMALSYTWRTLPKVTKVLALPAVAVAFVLDVAINLFATFIFVDLPQEWMLTQRVTRYKQTDTWRRPIALWMCRNMLDPFDVGGHCI